MSQPAWKTTRERITGFVRSLCRMMLCLSLWTGPAPMLHSHEHAGAVLERDPALATHVRVCHRHDHGDACRHWHLHLMLWGEIQSDLSDSQIPVPLPQPRHIDTQFAVATDGQNQSSDQLDFHGLLISWELMGEGLYATPGPTDPRHSESAQYMPYLHGVAAAYDLSQFSMVSRC